ncbi:MAG: multidrug efflux RND transporter periplasmic adaptor subunit VexE [Saprospiraceae bacterium]
MKFINIFLVLTLVLSACQAPAPEVENLDLEGKRALLMEKKAALQSITSEVETLEAEIAALDPTVASNRKLVTVQAVEKTTFERFAEIQGNVQSSETAAASAEVAGRILKLTVKEGDRVRSGQLIAALDLEQVNKQIAEIEKSLELAEDVFARQERLWKQNIGSELQYLEAKNNVERLNKTKETLAFQLTKSKVYAPITGVVDMANLEAGELALPGSPIINILSTNRLEVVVDLPENYLQAVRKGDAVTVIYPALDYEQEARINLIGSTINPTNRTFKAEIRTGNPGNRLKPNLLAVVKIKEFEQPDAVVIPLDLVQQEVGGKKYVMIADNGSDGTVAKKVYIQTGESYDGVVVVNSGLIGGEQLINKGGRSLANGDMLEITNAKMVSNNG